MYNPEPIMMVLMANWMYIGNDNIEWTSSSIDLKQDHSQVHDGYHRKLNNEVQNPAMPVFRAVSASDTIWKHGWSIAINTLSTLGSFLVVVITN